MDHVTLQQELRKSVDDAKGSDVEIEFTDEEKFLAGTPITNLTLTYSSDKGESYICLSGIHESLLENSAEAIIMDLFGPPFNEVVFRGRIGNRIFNLKILLNRLADDLS